MRAWSALRLVSFALCLSLPSGLAQDAAANTEHKVTMTFYITGLECPACVYNVINSVNDVKGVVDAKVDFILDGYANVTFDDSKATVHQIAQAVSEAYPLHGKPYEAALKLRIPDYAKGDNSAKVDAVLAKMKESVSAVVEDRSKGIFYLRFQPLKTKEGVIGQQGLALARIEHAINDPAPKGLGLVCEIVKEGQEPAKK